MSSNRIYKQGGLGVEIQVPATESIAIYTNGIAKVYRQLGYPNLPEKFSHIGTVTRGQSVFGPYSSGAVIMIDTDEAGALYQVGTDPVVTEFKGFRLQGTPGILNATGTLTAAMILSGIVTSTTAAAVAATLDTGTVLDAASEFAIGDSFDWAAIATGANTFTVTASSGHTIVGSGAVTTGTSGLFRTRKTAANTFVTYRIG